MLTNANSSFKAFQALNFKKEMFVLPIYQRLIDK